MEELNKQESDKKEVNAAMKNAVIVPANIQVLLHTFIPQKKQAECFKDWCEFDSEILHKKCNSVFEKKRAREAFFIAYGFALNRCGIV